MHAPFPQNACTVNISMGLRFVATILGGVLYLFLISWKLTLVMLSVVPLVAVGVLLYGKKVKGLSIEVRRMPHALTHTNAYTRTHMLTHAYTLTYIHVRTRTCTAHTSVPVRRNKTRAREDKCVGAEDACA